MACPKDQEFNFYFLIFAGNFLLKFKFNDVVAICHVNLNGNKQQYDKFF
jgi:hypothetical protein